MFCSNLIVNLKQRRKPMDAADTEAMATDANAVQEAAEEREEDTEVGSTAPGAGAEGRDSQLSTC